MINYLKSGRHVRKHLSAFIHEELDEKRKRSIEAHLRKCDRCWEEYKQILRGSELARKIVALQAPGDLWNEIEQNLSTSNSIGKLNRPLIQKGTANWLPGLVGATALLLVVLASWWFLEQAPKNTSAEVSLLNFIEHIESSTDSDAVKLAAQTLRNFNATSREKALDAAGMAHAAGSLPLADIPLTAQLLGNIDNREVVELEYSRDGAAFAVFIAPESVAFSFGERLIEETRVEELACKQVESAGTATYWFGAGGFHCVLISQLKDRQKNAAIIRYFVTAHDLLKTKRL